MQKYRVALIGINSLFGQASSLLLKLCPNIHNLRLYDETDTSTVDDIRVINSPCKVEAYQGKTNLNEAIKGSDIVLIGDDMLSTPQTCFDVMAPKMQDYAKAIAESSPNALIIVAASPINKLVPVLSELLQENGYYDCNRVMGTTATHNIRANCIVASYFNTDPRTVFLPVVGGDSEDTIVPLFSQAKPHLNISEAIMKRLIEDIKQASHLIYETKGTTEALNKAHATVKFLNSVIKGLRGEPNIMNIAFTKTTQVDGTEYFALPVLFGRFGIQARYGIPRILPFENDLIRESVLSLQKDTEFAKLFCKTRETAAETCSRNIAIRYKKSKEFEQFVNGLKVNKKGSVTEDKIADRIKPPISVESGQLSGDQTFDPKAFCLRHKVDNQGENKIIPAYIRTGESIMPVSLGYTFGNDNGTAQFVPKSVSAETPVCEPVVCPDKPIGKEISYTSIVSLVERLVKKSTEKIMNEKEKDKSLKESWKKVSLEKDKNLRVGLGEDKILKTSPDKDENVNGRLRKIDMLKMNSENVGKFKSSYKNLNFSQKAKKHENKNSKSYGLIKNKSIPITHDVTYIGDRTAIPLGNVNINDKTNSRKRKYSEKNLELIFRPTSTFKDSFEYNSGIRKLNHSKDFKQTETKQNISMNNKKHTETTAAKHDNNRVQRLFNFKYNGQSSQNWNRILPAINTPTSGENKNCRNMLINETQDKEKKDFNIIMSNERHTETTTAKDDSYNEVQRISNFKSNSNQSSQYRNRIIPTINTPFSGENKNFRDTVINENILNQIEYKNAQDKEKDFKKGQQNISIPESDLCKQILHNTFNDSEKHISGDNDKKIAISNNSGNVDGEHIHTVQDYKIEQYNKSDNLESNKNEKLANNIKKLENNKYIGDRYKNISKNREYIFDKTYNENDPLLKIKEIKNMKNVLLGNLNSSMKKKSMVYEKINKKAYELLVGRNLERNRNIGNCKSLLSDKSCKDTKDFVKNKLRSKHLINRSANNRLVKGEKDNISHTKNIRTNSENKSNNEIRRVCYNSFLNEVTQINNKVDSCDLEIFSTLDNQFTGQNNNIEKNSMVPCKKEFKSIPEPKHDKKQIDISFQEKQDNVNDNKDLSILMKTLDSDVFKYDDKVYTNITKDEVKQVNTCENDSHLPEVQEQITDITASNQEHITKECNELIKSEIKEKLSPDLENSQIIHQTENPKPTEMTFEDVIKELKLAMQSSDQQNKSIDMNKPSKDEKSISNVGKENTEIKNETKNHEEQTNEGSDSFPQSKEVISQKESTISNKNIAHEPIPEGKRSVKNQINLNHWKMSKIDSVLQNISKSSEKIRKNLNKCNQGKSHIQAKVPCSSNNPGYINKVSLTIPEIILSKKSRNSRSNKRINIHEGDSVSYIKSLRSSSKEINKPRKKNAKQEVYKVVIKNLNDFEIPVKSVEQKNTSNKNSIKLNKPLTPLSKCSKPFITSKYNSLISKKKNVSEMQVFFTGRFGQKVNEINKAEHSFSLRDKNGINNYFLLKGLLPKIKNNKHNLDNQNGSISLLKTNACNEDPFMSIKDKHKSKINTANKKLVKPNLNKKNVYTSNDGSSESGSLLITHNSVYNPNCPVHGFKDYLNRKDDHNKSIPPTNIGNMLRINEAMLSNLCNKVRNSEKNSSHQLNQTTHNFKLYSTSALPMKNKSPSCLCVEKKKTLKQVLMSKTEGIRAKLPKGFIKKQRITKILEKDFKKIIPQKSKYKNAETPAKETKTFVERHARNFEERNKTQKNCHLHPQFMSRTTKIDENIFNPRFESTYIEKYLKLPPKHIPHHEFFSKHYQKYRNSQNGRRVADIYKINWSDSQNNNQQTKTSSVSVENDILVRGTCIDHVRNKFVSNKAPTHELSYDAYSDEQKTVVNSTAPSSLSNAFVQYTKDFGKCEYPTNQKLPSIRKLHKCAFRSS